MNENHAYYGVYLNWEVICFWSVSWKHHFRWFVKQWIWWKFILPFMFSFYKILEVVGIVFIFVGFLKVLVYEFRMASFAHWKVCSLPFRHFNSTFPYFIWLRTIWTLLISDGILLSLIKLNSFIFSPKSERGKQKQILFGNLEH